MTYRIGAHSTSDDDSKYRRPDSVEGFDSERAYWEARSPIIRFGRYLASRLVDRRGGGGAAQGGARACNQGAQAEKRKQPHIDHLFTDVYDELPWLLQQQQRELKSHLAKYSDHYADIPSEQYA